MRAIGVVVLVLLSVLLSSAVQAADSVKEITGYGKYSLGMQVSQLDLETFRDPEPDITFGENWLPDDSGVYIKTISLPAGNKDDLSEMMGGGLFVTTANNRVVMIRLNFAPFDDGVKMDKIDDFARNLRDGMLAKYDRSLLDSNEFDFSKHTGSLVLVDKNDNRLVFDWKEGKWCDITYYTPEVWQIVLKKYADANKGEQGAVEDL